MQKYANEICHKLNPLAYETSTFHSLMPKTVNFHINFVPCHKGMNSREKSLRFAFIIEC